MISKMMAITELLITDIVMISSANGRILMVTLGSKSKKWVCSEISKYARRTITV